MPTGSFAAKPKTLYRSGDKYSRTEEELNVQDGIHALLITNEPDTWMINLADKTGRHIVDPGPTFFVHAPIVWIPALNGQPEQNKDFKDLEYGNETKFFRGHNASSVGTRVIDGKNCNTLSIRKDDREFVLFITADEGKPRQLDVIKNNKNEYSIRYLVYETNLPFRKSFFQPPKGLKITEAK